jgi:hypothetical protein
MERALMQQFAFTGQRDASCGAMKQAGAEALLKRVDRIGHARAYHAQCFGGARETAVFGNRDKDAKALDKGHGAPFNCYHSR